jgi:hypothetical protein
LIPLVAGPWLAVLEQMLIPVAADPFTVLLIEDDGVSCAQTNKARGAALLWKRPSYWSRGGPMATNHPLLALDIRQSALTSHYMGLLHLTQPERGSPASRGSIPG